jgi:hypothetical protein
MVLDALARLASSAQDRNLPTVSGLRWNTAPDLRDFRCLLELLEHCT